MPSSEVTVVTAFYPLQNGPSKKQYRLWLRSLCKIPCSLIIFTTEEISLELHQWRLPFLDQTQIRVRPLESFAMACPLMMNFWTKQEKLDPTRDRYRGSSYQDYRMSYKLHHALRLRRYSDTYPSDRGSS